MKKILNRLFEHQKLSKEEAKEVLIKISKSEYNDAQVAAFISVYLMRSISVDELNGFREALLELCIPIDLRGAKTIDLCGTGGDGKNTFNISTLSSFVVAGAGYKVSKHGNYGVSSVCGSSNVLQHLGYQFTNDEGQLLKQLDAANICFFHAPLFHPALKGVGPIRRQLGVKTFFNMLGPLVNPARNTHQLVGVFSLKLARLYQYLFENSGTEYRIVHALDGYDEVSLTGKAKVISRDGEQIIAPEYFNKKQLSPDEIFGGDSIEDAAEIFTKILRGEGTDAQNSVVLANSSLAINTFRKDKNIRESMALAEASLLNGKALKSFETLVKLSAA